MGRIARDQDAAFGIIARGTERAVDDPGKLNRGVEAGIKEAAAERTGLVALSTVGVEVGSGAFFDGRENIVGWRKGRKRGRRRWKSGNVEVTGGG